ncbi:anti-sigma factor [Alkalicoccus chagannorensis]|uniref:anti-sigma factor n=1 Tax=Alkalicoccus chagannorensis TaxID=427072 RepID=UPI0004085B3F|nr:anti-sigma factor [Alkalicoccus chagannorensis]
MAHQECDKLIDYFNGHLSEEEKQAFEQHMQACPSCREELAEWEALSAELPFLSEAEEPPEGMKERVLTNVWNSDDTSSPETSAPALDEKRRSRKGPLATWFVGAAAAALLFSLAGNGYLLMENQQLAEDREQLAGEAEQLAFERDVIEADYEALLEQEDEEGGVADVLLASNLASTDEELFTGEGSATIIAEDGHVDLLVQVSGMPELEGEEAFQAWVIEGETPISAGSFTIDDDGNGAVRYRLSDMDDIQVDQIAITLEPQPNNEQPQGQMVLASP